MANFQGLLNETTYQDLFNEASDANPPIVEDNNLGRLCLDEIMDEWKKINFRRSQLLWAVKQRWLRVYEDSRAENSYSCEDDLSSTSEADIIPEYSPEIQLLLKLFEESPDDIQQVIGYEEFVQHCLDAELRQKSEMKRLNLCWHTSCDYLMAYLILPPLCKRFFEYDEFYQRCKYTELALFKDTQ